MSVELSTLSSMADELYSAEQEVLRLEGELARAKLRRDRLSSVDIPEAMGAVGMTSFATADFAIEVESTISVSPPKANREKIFELLREQGHGALIKNVVSVAFSRGQDENAAEMVAVLTKAGRDVKQETKVEPATLSKYVRDRLEAGEPVDTELFGVYQARKTKFTKGAPQAPAFENEDQ